MKLKSLNCPNCGAPLPVTRKQAIAICLYCSASVRIEPWSEATGFRTAGSPYSATVIAEIPPSVSERVKQMVLEGGRDEAIRFYAERGGVSPAEAETAVNQLAVALVSKLTAQAPFRTGWLFVHSLIVAGLALALVWGIQFVRSGSFWPIYVLLILGFIPFFYLRSLIPRAISTWVRSFGSEAHARILKSSAIRPMRQGAMLVRVFMEVQPLDGKPPFQDEETILIRTESLFKVQECKVIRVRYARGRTDRVCITSVEPMETGK